MYKLLILLINIPILFLLQGCYPASVVSSAAAVGSGAGSIKKSITNFRTDHIRKKFIAEFHKTNLEREKSGLEPVDLCIAKRSLDPKWAQEDAACCHLPEDETKACSEKKEQPFDLKAGKTELVNKFFKSSNHYLAALALLNKSLGKNTEAAQIEKAIEYANNLGIDEVDRMKNSIIVVSESNKTIKDDLMNDKAELSAAAKAFYVQSLPQAMKGFIETVNLAPVTFKMINGIAANPFTAKREIGGVAIITPQLPAYIKTIYSTMKQITRKAKAADIDIPDESKIKENMLKLAKLLKLPISKVKEDEMDL